MVHAEDFCKALQKANIHFISGVPDSLLADLCACFSDIYSSYEHLITANEGNAVAMAIGHFLATENPGLVYMQNSGLGNAVNPITSLATQEVYSIPMLLVIGWRGEIDENGAQLQDEPQHVLQGKITKSLLDLLGIPFYILDKDSDIKVIVEKAVKQTKTEQKPVALLVRKNTFEKYKNKIIKHKSETLTRENALEAVISALDLTIPVISTTGKISRELYELRKTISKKEQRDFLTVGGMGHACSIAAGFANSYKGKVACLDGDGAMIMHMGALTTSANSNNLLHIVFNNGAHESVGGQATMGLELSLKEIAAKCGYREIYEANSEESIKKVLADAVKKNVSIFIEITCSNSSRPDLGRPEKSARKNRDDFMNFVNKRI